MPRRPCPMGDEESDVEIRPLFEADDFGEEFTPELRAKEADLEVALSMEMAAVQPYLFFGGCCEEALQYYKTALHAKVGKVWSQRFGMVTDKFGVEWMVLVPGQNS